MPSLQQLHRRIKSIQNTHQITKAMELVAASKMRKAQQSAIQSRSYAHEGFSLVKDLSAKVDRSIHPLMAHRDIQAFLLIVVTSNRGLAGAYNALILRKVLAFLQISQDKTIDIITVGKKGQDILSKISGHFNLIATYSSFPAKPSIQDVAPIIKTAIDGFVQKTYDSIQIGYTHFHSTVKQEPIIEELLPIKNSLGSEQIVANGANGSTEQHLDYQFEPNPDKIFDFVLPRMVEMQIYQRMLEAIASEHSARMVAMKNASDNANEIIGDLKLAYNSTRQSKITQELLEITSTGAHI